MINQVVLSILLSQANPVDSVVQKYLDLGLKGVGVAVVQDGKVVHLKTYGQGATLKNDGRYRLASISKQFTAAVIVKLVREKKLRYEDTLGKLMPDTPSAWHKVTVRQLLTHTGGLPSYSESPKLGAVRNDPVKPDGIWKLVADEPMIFEPGTAYRYSNTGYCILGTLIERTTKQDFYSALDSMILKPAGMRSTGPEKRFKVVESFGREGEPTEPINMDWVYAAGGLVSSLQDMVKWDRALAGTELFSEAEKHLMFNPEPITIKSNDNYGFGWLSNYVDGELYSYSHTGGIRGFSTVIERTVRGVTVIALANHQNDTVRSLRAEIRDMFDPKPKASPLKDTMPDLTEKHRKMLDDLLAGTCDESIFTPLFLSRVPPANLIATIKRFTDLGPLNEFTLARSAGDKEVQRVYRVVFGTTALSLHVSIGADGLIGAMSIR